MTKFLFLSIKPKYVEKIFNGEKTIELRKCKPNVKEGDFIIIYSTTPEKSVVGFGKIKNVIDIAPSSLWEKHSHVLGINKDDYDRYFRNCNRSIGIEIMSLCKFDLALSLVKIKAKYPGFTPPQTFKYLSKFQAFRIYLSASHKFS